MRLLPKHPASLASGARGVDRLLGPMIGIAAAMLAAAWFLPMMSVQRFVFWQDDLSFAAALFELVESGEYGLFAILFVFSVVFPVVKLLLAFILWRRVDAKDPNLMRYLGLIEQFGRWSMLDVFVVALSVVAIKFSIIANVEVHWGVYFFATAILTSMVVVQRLTRMAFAHSWPAPLKTGD
jgi:paraquat-inducible protein A